jgi:sugar O-acyltransferase (sialic acid O-acetyltransferase NeuD family)
VVVLGAGGHAKVVLRTLEISGYEVVGVFDDDPAKMGMSLLGHAVQGSIEDAALLGCPRAVLAVGNNRTRQDLAERLPEFEWITAVHPTAWVDASVTIAPGTVIFAGAVVQPETVIGRHVIVNTAATVDHDCLLGDFVHVAPGAHLAGQVSLGEGSFLGIGSTVIPGKQVGGWVTVGAGGVVVEDIPAGVTVVGVPARQKQTMEA